MQSENDSQVSNSDCIQTTVKNSKRKRKLSRPKKVKKPRKDDNNVQDTSREVSLQNSSVLSGLNRDINNGIIETIE